MEYCFIQVADAGDLTVPHSIEPIRALFRVYGAVSLQCHPNVGLQKVNCLWFVGITLFFDGDPQEINKRCQIAASWWPICITISAN